MSECYESLTLNGKQVLVSKTRKSTFKVKRSWKERLFSLPFKPFKKTKDETTFTDLVKDDECIFFEDKILVNEKTFHKLRAESKKLENNAA
jgi:hypothetical protein